jgi:hypothetical protein
MLHTGRLKFLLDIAEIIRTRAGLFRALAHIRRKIFIVDLGLKPSGTTRVAMESLLLRNREGNLKCI